jgi:uncharacterized ferritin-like protein (DUF455 family)
MFGSVEDWAVHYIESVELSVKLAPPSPPEHFLSAPPRRLPAPGRPPELTIAKKGERLPKAQALIEPRHRARVLHAFFHHEMQAAELMCWAILAFSDAELAFRQGLLRVCLDEIRHMNIYRRHINALGFAIGDFGVRDWFWSKVPECQTKLNFVAVMGMGLEAANLEHAPTFAERFRAVGDEAGARIQEEVAGDELAHVRFGTHWFKVWSGGCDFETWVEALPKPWSPWVLKGDPLAIETRRTAGMSDAFLSALAAYEPEKKGRTSE